MVHILFCSQKGGTGKTLISDELMFSLERSGIPTTFFELDTQGGSQHKRSEAENAEVTVIDTPGYLQDKLPQYLKAADVIVIPCRASYQDQPALGAMRKMVSTYAPETPVVIIQNGWNRYWANREFGNWLNENKREQETVVPLRQSEAFIRAGLNQESVLKSAPNSVPAQNMIEVINTIRRTAGLPEEQMAGSEPKKKSEAAS